MLIDRSHKSWIWVCGAILAASSVLYLVYVNSSPEGPSGGSWPGLAYGIAGAAMMLYAALLGPRKKAPTLRVGRLHSWMKGHVWLGILSFPMIWFHAGFEFGGRLTTWLMVLLIVVFVSGIVGLALQQYVPRMMLRELQAETIYEQIEHVAAQMESEAEQSVELLRARPRQGAFEVEAISPRATSLDRQEELVYLTLRGFFEKELRPFLRNQRDASSQLFEAHRAEWAFERLRTMVPTDVHDVIEAWEEFVEERRQLARQKRMHLLLHGWLVVHAPISVALLVLGAIHAVIALRYV